VYSLEDEDFSRERAAPWLRELLLPVLVFFVAAAIVCALVLGGVVRGTRTYAGPAAAPTTQPTVLIEPRLRCSSPARRGR
jgi:hypothetical protein